MLYNFGRLGDPCPCVATDKEQYLAAPTVQASLFFLKKNVMLQVNMLGLNYSFLVIITFAMTNGNLTFMSASVRSLLFD